MRTCWLSALLVAGSFSAPDAAAQAILLRDANVVDPAAQRINRASIVIDGDSIVSITPSAPRGFRGTTIDLRGKWVMPGLFDGHVHSYGNMGPTSSVVEAIGAERVAATVLRAGVTGYLDFNHTEDVLPLRNRSRNGELRGADIYASGTSFTAPGGHGTQFPGAKPRTMVTPDEARRHVAELAPRQPDVIKIVYTPPGPRSLDKPTVEAIIDASRQSGLKTVVHIDRWSEALDVVLAGANAITHLAVDTVTDEVVLALRDRSVAVIPTAIFRFEAARLRRDSAALESPLLSRVTAPRMIDAYRNPPAQTPERRARLAELEEAAKRTLAKLAAGGVSIMAGTDAGNPGVIHGFTLHRELEFYVAAGLTPWQALASATVTPGLFLGARYGMRSGALANLVVLSASPVDDIRNTQKIEMVFVRGQAVDGIGQAAR